MFNHCLTDSYTGLGAIGLLGADNEPPVGLGVDAYYRAGTPFMFIAQDTAVAPALSFNPAESARSALASALAGSGYKVKVIYGSPSMLTFGSGGGVLEVSGYQNIDRAKAFHIRDQIIGAAQAAGFNRLAGILFNVESSGSNWRVGSPGAQTQWGDLTPVAPVSIFQELGVDLSGDTSFIGGSIKNLVLYGAIGLGIFALISSRRR